MKISVLTIFPEFFTSVLDVSILKRSIAKGIIEVELVNIRDFSLSKTKRIDAPSIGGGAGLIMQLQPLVAALRATRTKDSHVILFSPQGRTLNQSRVHELKTFKHLILICGHYEGVDDRIKNYIDEEISLGDYILTGGEYAAITLMDAINRLLEDSITHASLNEESFETGLLEYPQYAEPYDFEGYKVPEILYTGNHQAIKKYRHKKSLKRTQERRPDLLKNLTGKEQELLFEDEYSKEEIALIQKSKFTKHK
ncbi:MAG: tRNA (guanosine(37)-N1)-methyltransferase TrmD [Erysipelotrichaceae bacterium]|jgi:tRNA (guanine37-N1)-methyltransferase|nr:tRNA (guanosine(37)-N1)-methyltransferase TrmD [Erysipelotrichaceae bacterium]